MTKWIKPSEVEINLNDFPDTVAKARSLGWWKEGEEAPKNPTLNSLSKEDLESYAKKKFGVDLDKRKSIQNLIKEVEALENGNG